MLAASAASIAAAIGQTGSDQFGSFHYIWLAAVALWGICFLLGLVRIEIEKELLFQLGMMISDEPPKDSASVFERDEHDKRWAEHSASVNKLESMGKRIARVQLCLFALGGLTYLVFHVLRMQSL